MEARKKPPLISIVGPTASGKSGVALRLAVRYQGEVISVDSRSIYQGMDIGTAKPTLAEQAAAPHWGLDLIKPGERFTAYDFKTYAYATIEEIRRRGKLPILAGGTGLYFDSIWFDFSFRRPPQPSIRSELEEMNAAELQAMIRRRGWPMPDNDRNRMHLIRVIESQGQKPNKSGLRPDMWTYGIMPDEKELRKNISARVEGMFKAGLMEEVKLLRQKYGTTFDRVAGIGYKMCLLHLDGEVSLAEAKSLFKQADWQYARRQRTWFRRHDFITWCKTPEECYSIISRRLEDT